MFLFTLFRIHKNNKMALALIKLWSAVAMFALSGLLCTSTTEHINIVEPSSDLLVLTYYRKRSCITKNCDFWNKADFLERSYENRFLRMNCYCKWSKYLLLPRNKNVMTKKVSKSEKKHETVQSFDCIGDYTHIYIDFPWR